MEHVIGASDWNWKVPNRYNYKKGIEFIHKFVSVYNRYPCWGAVTAYTSLMEYKKAVERASTFHSVSVIKALEGQ